MNPFSREGTGVLVLTRKVGEGIAIGDDVKIIVMQIKGKQVRLGIKASPTTIVHREEIYQRIQDENRSAAESGTDRASLDHAREIIGRRDGDLPADTPLRRTIKRRPGDDS